MAEKLVRLTAEQRSNFVAYLDGELDEQQTQDIEQLLARSSVARHDMELLAATWELLDTLPRPQAPENFSQKTMATVQLEQKQPALQEQPWFLQTQRLSLLLAGWVLVLLCGVGGFVAARSLPPSDADLLINHYPVIKQLDRYQEIGTVEFLEKLQRSPLWTKRDSQTRKEPPQ